MRSGSTGYLNAFGYFFHFLQPGFGHRERILGASRAVRNLLDELEI